MSYTSRGRKDSAKLLKALIGAGAAGKGAWFAAMQQAVENAVDAKATAIHITVDKRNQTFRLIDNGEGFRKPNIDGFYSLFISPKEGLEGLIGKNGSGRIFLLQVSKKMTVHTLSEDFPQMVQFSLTIDDLRDLLERESIERTIEPAEKPDWWKLPGTGAAVSLHEVAWKNIPSPGEIVARFASYLKPSVARMISVNGIPLQSRAIVGDIVHESIQVSYLNGVQEIEFFVPKGKSRFETVRLGGYNPICPLRDVMAEMPPELAQLIPTELIASLMVGDVFIPELNRFRAHDGRSLEQGFYQSELLDKVVRFLLEEVWPRVADAFSRKEQADELNLKRRLLTSICETVNVAFPLDESFVTDGEGDDEGTAPTHPPDKGGNSPRPPPPPTIHFAPRNVVLTPGQRQKFRIIRISGTSGKFTWNAAGGTLNPKRGREVTFTAGKKFGRFELVVCDQKRPSMTATAKISIVAEKHLAISPLRVDIPAGEDQDFALLNSEGTSGKIQWNILESTSGLSLTRMRGLKTTVQVADGVPQGDYTLIAFDEEAPETRAEATFEVIPSEDFKNMIKIEDRTYDLDLADMALPNMVERRKASRLETRSATGRIVADVLALDADHPHLKALAKLSSAPEAKVQALLPHLVAAHLQGLIEDQEESFDEVRFRGRLSALLTQIMGARLAATDDDDDETP